MEFKTWEGKLAAIAAYDKQVANENAIREAMNNILQTGAYEEDDLPQNDDLRAEVQTLVRTNSYIFSALDEIGIDYIKCAGFKCFKADDADTCVESVYFISSSLTLLLDDSWL